MDFKDKLENSKVFKETTDKDKIREIFNLIYFALPKPGQRWKHSRSCVWIRVTDEEGISELGVRRGSFYSYEEGHRDRGIVTTNLNEKDIIILGDKNEKL